MPENKSVAPAMGRQWLVYILSCRDGTLYTGITTDLVRRLAAHNSGRGGARYTRARRPVSVVYTEAASSRSVAAQREWEIKAMTASQKRALIGQAALPAGVSAGALCERQSDTIAKPAHGTIFLHKDFHHAI